MPINKLNVPRRKKYLYLIQVGKRVLCRHPFEESKRAYVMPHKVEPLYRKVWGEGKMINVPTLDQIRQNVQSSLKSLRQDHKRSLNPTPYKVWYILLSCSGLASRREAANKKCFH